MTHPAPVPRLLPPSPDGSPLDEAEALRRARRDPAAFGYLYRANYAAIARYVQRRVGDPNTSDDLVAETFTVALQKLDQFRDRGQPLRAWLYRLASTQVNRWARGQRRRATRSLQGDPSAPAERAEHGATELARAALLSLPPRYQTVLALHYLEGVSVVDIAIALGCRPGTVKARLSRGRDRLRRKLQPIAEDLFR